MKKFLTICVAVLALSWEVLAAEAVVSVKADRINCRYATGEVARLTVSVRDGKGAPLTNGQVVCSLDNVGARKLGPDRTVDLARENPFVVTMTRDRPGFARLCVRSATEGLKIRKNAGNHAEAYAFGVAFAPTEIVPGTPDSADFDAFWKEAIANLDRDVPADAKIEPMPERETATMRYFRVSFATAGGRRVYGWLSEPKDLEKGPFPVRIRVPGAGIGFTGPLAYEGAVCLTMNVHSYAQPEGNGTAADAKRKRLYDEQDRLYAMPHGVKRYCQAGIHLGRETYFYYASILGINRAINWLATRPECDLKDFTYCGTSQGGGFGLYLTALNRHITRGVIHVPALTDLLGDKIEDRQSGWPQIIDAQKPENRAAAERWAPYFCGVNFARRITCPVRFVAGFSDDVCSANAVYSAYNVCPSKDKDVLDGIGMGHGVYGDFYVYLGAWEMAGNLGKPSCRFLAFNIWGDYFGNPVEERDAREAALVKRWDPDFAAFQEVTGNFWKSRLFADLADTYEVVGRGMGLYELDAFTPVAFRKARFELVEKGSEWFCPELDVSKGVVWAVVKDRFDGRKYVVFSSHFWWQEKSKGDDWVRLDNARRLASRLHELAMRHDAAIVGGGDLNASIDSWAMQHLVNAGLSDAQQGAVITPKTFPTDHYNPVRDAKGAYVGVPAVREIAEKTWSLDHVFYDARRLTARRFDLDISPEACALSDHHPIVADFEAVR